AMMVNTSQPMPMMIHSGIAMIRPMPNVITDNRNSTTNAIATVMLKFSASLPWSLTNGMVSFLTSQITSGPMKQPQPPPQTPVSSAPNSADRWANIAHCRSSADGAPAMGSLGGGGTTDSGGTLMRISFEVGTCVNGSPAGRRCCRS